MVNFHNDLLTRRVKEIYKISSEDDLTIFTVKASTLLVPQRIDLLIKLLYVEAKVTGYGLDYALNVYINHIHAITAFKDEENGQADKNNIDAFVKTFDSLISEIKENGFDATKSVIPISSDNIILDGAHRLACCIYFNIPVSVTKIEHVGLSKEIVPPIYDWKYFKRYLLEQNILDTAARQYIKYINNNIYIACLWPKASDVAKRQNAIELIKKEYHIVYIKSFSPSFRLFDRLIAQIYMHDSWVGNIENGFSGSQGKSLLTYKKGSELTFIVFEGSGNGDIISFKDRVREIFQIGKHSIHITDNAEQSAFLADVVLNDNSLRFLEEADAQKYKLSIKNIYDAYKVGDILNLNAAKILWGLEDNGTDDVILNNKEILPPYSISDVAADPSAYFNYLGMKVIMPTDYVAKKYLVNYSDSNLITEIRKKRMHIKEAIYLLKIYKIKIKDAIRSILIKHSRINEILHSFKKT